MWTVVCGNYPVGNCLRGIYPRCEFSAAIVLGLIILGAMIQGDYPRSFFIIYHYFSLSFYYFRFCNGKWLIRSKTEQVLKIEKVVFRGLRIRLNVIGEVTSLYKYFKQFFVVNSLMVAFNFKTILIEDFFSFDFFSLTLRPQLTITFRT